MRKWMAERLKRRKKEPEKATGEKAQAPLQPSFYDTAPVEPTHARAAQQPEDHAEAQHAHAEASRVSEAENLPEARPSEARSSEGRSSQASAPRPQGTD